MSMEQNAATSYSVGDPVCVSDAEGDYLGVVIDHLSSEALSVQMIKKFGDGLYRTTSDAYEVPLSAIEVHEHLQSDDDAPKAFNKLGYRMLDGGTFVKLTDEEEHGAPIGSAEFDMYSSDDESVGSLCDFIVPDDECEPFTLAQDDSKFVQETHQAVREFNQWVPKTEAEVQTKQFIQSQEQKAVFIDDNARFARNLPGAASYSNPV